MVIRRWFACLSADGSSHRALAYHMSSRRAVLQSRLQSISVQLQSIYVQLVVDLCGPTALVRRSERTAEGGTTPSV